MNPWLITAVTLLSFTPTAEIREYTVQGVYHGLVYGIQAVHCMVLTAQQIHWYGPGKVEETHSSVWWDEWLWFGLHICGIIFPEATIIVTLCIYLIKKLQTQGILLSFDIHYSKTTFGRTEIADIVKVCKTSKQGSHQAHLDWCTSVVILKLVKDSGFEKHVLGWRGGPKQFLLLIFFWYDQLQGIPTWSFATFSAFYYSAFDNPGCHQTKSMSLLLFDSFLHKLINFWCCQNI